MEVRITNIKYENTGCVPIYLEYEGDINLYNLYHAVRNASVEYCNTPEGRAVYEQNGNRFSWEDFEQYVPSAICEKYGFRKIEKECEDIRVNWDDRLVADSDIKNNAAYANFIEMIDNSKINRGSFLSCIWDQCGINVCLDYYFDRYGNATDYTMLYQVLYTDEDDQPSEENWTFAKGVTAYLKTKYQICCEINRETEK